VAFLEIDGVVVRFGRMDVLRGVSLAVERGTLVALLGASGCGKTTLLRAVCGFGDVVRGRVSLAGRDITHLPPEKRDTAMVFQSYALWPHMTVAQNMAYGLRLRRVGKAEIARKIDALLALLQLDGLADRLVTQLSGGQRQRVALGRALAIDPSVLLLDEPLSNLDARIRLGLRHEIRAVQTRLGITALHVTHDREEAMVMADRIVVLRDGRIEQQGTPQELYHHPSSAFVASFMGADNVIRVRLEGEVARFDPQGAHDAYFRATAARLLPQDESAPEEALKLPGEIAQVSYPGGLWRYTVQVGDRRFLIDDPVRHEPGAAMQVVIPADALHVFPAN
jgi:putative spermidine/putrescine transport system ATP-binding protein